MFVLLCDAWVTLPIIIFLTVVVYNHFYTTLFSEYSVLFIFYLIRTVNEYFSLYVDRN